MGLSEAKDWLRRARGETGWGYLPGAPPRLEPSLWAAAVLGEDDLAWLVDAPISWEWLLVPALLHDVSGAQPLRERALAFLMENEGLFIADSPHLDGTLQGWTWTEGTFTWLEPTCFAMISLSRSERATDDRWRVGRAILADRVCDDGGWNYGNSNVLGGRLMSYAHSTAWAVMALKPDDPLVAGAQAVLEGALELPSTRALATSALARMAAGLDPTPWVEALVARQNSDGSFGQGRVDRTGLAAAALQAYDTGKSVVTGPVPWRKPAAEPIPATEGADEQE